MPQALPTGRLGEQLPAWEDRRGRGAGSPRRAQETGRSCKNHRRARTHRLRSGRCCFQCPWL
eukprot:4631231-Alexandrium_andersonii.AAC.1